MSWSLIFQKRKAGVWWPRLWSLCVRMGGILIVAGMGWAAGRVTLKPLGASLSIGRFEKIGFRIEGSFVATNPFDPRQVQVDLEVETPSGRRIQVPAFFYQDYEMRLLGHGEEWFYPKGLPLWRARFAPMEIGPYRVRVVWRDQTGSGTSPWIGLVCVPSSNPGFLRVSRKAPRYLEFSTGKPFFGIGQNLAFIGDQQYFNLSKALVAFRKLARYGANYLRIWTCCGDWAMGIETRKSAWMRSWSKDRPIRPYPTDPSIRCVELSPARRVVSCQPSHRVGLLPSTEYLFRVQGRVSGDARLRVEGLPGGTSWEPNLPKDRWGWVEVRFRTEPNRWFLPAVRFRLIGEGTVWIRNVSLKEANGGAELLWEADPNRQVPGTYNPLDSWWLDRLVEEAEQQGIYLQLCMLARDLYMPRLRDPSSKAYEEAIEDAKRFFRYAIGRWGWATSIAAWEYWNEMNPHLPTDRFYHELGLYLKQADVYHHLRMTSTWAPSPKDCRHPDLDVAEIHYYYRPSDRKRYANEVVAVVDRMRWVREHAPDRPVHLGEFGLANEQWRLTETMRQSREVLGHFHGLWASALSGGYTTALSWWWERLDARNHYPLYEPLAKFLEDVPWTSGKVRPFQDSISVQGNSFQVLGLRAGGEVWAWIFDPRSSWDSVVVQQRRPPVVEGLIWDVEGLRAGEYRIQFMNPRDGEILKTQIKGLGSGGEGKRLSLPMFQGSLAIRIQKIKS